MSAEFDVYINNYRANLDRSLALSGETSTFFAEYKVQKLKEWLPHHISNQSKILDFGCGDGLMTYFLKKYFPTAEIHGVDSSSQSIKRAQELFRTIIFNVNSEQSTHLDFPDELFDVIVSAGTFHHIPFAMHNGYLQEINRILKPGGIFVLFELNPYNPLTVLTFKRNPIDKNATMLKPGYARQLCQTVWKESIDLKYYCFYPHFLKKLRCTEKYLTKLPLGALYATLCYKK